MNNWRLLLLAVVVVVQPIGSFTESNLIDGRECCKRSEDAKLYGYRKTEEHRLLDGNRENRPTNNEQRGLRSLQDIREEMRYETIRSLMVTGSDFLERTKKRITELREPPRRLVKEQDRHHRDTFSRIREARDARSRDESKYILDENKRDSRESRYRNTLDAARTVRLSRDTKDTRSVERKSRNTVSRLPIRNSRSTEERRILPNRETIIKRAQKDITHSITRRDSRLSTPDRSKSRIELYDNIFEHRTEDGIEFGRSRFSDTRINEVRVVRTQTNIKYNERNIRDFREVRINLSRHQQDTEFGDKVSAVRRVSERISTDRMRESADESARLIRDSEDTRNNEEINERRMQRDESRRSMDSLRNTVERRLDSRQTRSSRNLDMTNLARNGERIKQRSVSMDRLSRLREPLGTRLFIASERNSRDERVAKIGDVRNDVSDDRRQERDSYYVSRDRTNDPRQESRKITSRMDARESSEQRRQQREVSQLSRGKPISAIREAQSSEHVQNRDDQGRTERARNIINSLRISAHANFHKQDSRSRRDVRGDERPDLRRQVLARSMEKARMIRSTSTERSNDIRETSGDSRSVEASMIREDTTNEINERRQTHDQYKNIEQRMTRNVAILHRLDTRRSSRANNLRVERVLRNRNDVRESGDQDITERKIVQRVIQNVATPQRLDNRRTSRAESSRLERLVRVRAEIKENDRREMQNEERVTDRTTSLLNRRSNERMFAQRRIETRESPEDSRKVRMTRNRGEVSERDLPALQENRDSRYVREIRLDDRSSRHQRDSASDLRERSLQRESRGVTERLTEKPRNYRNLDTVTFRDTLDLDSEEPVFSNWQMVFYTLQGVYLCGLLVQMLTENTNKTKKRTFKWWSSTKNLIKVD